MPTQLRRRFVTLLVAPLLLGALSAAAPAPAIHAVAADQLYYKETFYSNATYSQVVGVGYGYCDGDYIMYSGYQTAYSKYKFIAPCP